MAIDRRALNLLSTSVQNPNVETMSISHFKHILFHVFVCLSSWTLAAELLFVEELIAGYELSIAQSAGYSTDIVTVDQWLTMKTSDFSKYKALIISDPGTLYVSDLSFLVQTAETWGPAITGNIVIFGRYGQKLVSGCLLTRIRN